MLGQIWAREAVRFQARNHDTGRLVATHVGIADTRVGRAVGLLGRRGLDPGEGLWIVPSRGVHTFMMRFAIDVIALDDRGHVIDVVHAMAPWRVRLPRRGTVGVLELAAGALGCSGTEIGHTVAFEIVTEKACADEAPVSKAS